MKNFKQGNQNMYADLTREYNPMYVMDYFHKGQYYVVRTVLLSCDSFLFIRKFNLIQD